jgi:hypothetical protein
MTKDKEQNQDIPREESDLDLVLEERKAKIRVYEKPTIVKLDECKQGDFWCD